MENKKRIFDIIIFSIFGILLILLIKTIIGFEINKSFVKNFESGKYIKGLEDILISTTLFEKYVPYYNRGNQAYQEGDYAEAAKYYKKALEKHVPKGKECDIRVNYALSLVMQINPTNFADSAHSKQSLTIIQQAEDILTEQECAKYPPDKGHDEDAQKLLEELEKLKQQLQDQSNDQNQSENQSQNESNNQSKNESSKNDTQNQEEKEGYNGLENQIRNLQKNTIDSRQSTLDNDEMVYGNGMSGSRYREKNW